MSKPTTTSQRADIAIIGGGFSGHAHRRQPGASQPRAAQPDCHQSTTAHGTRSCLRNPARRAPAQRCGAQHVCFFPTCRIISCNGCAPAREYDTLPEHELRERFIPADDLRRLPPLPHAAAFASADRIRAGADNHRGRRRGRYFPQRKRRGDPSGRWRPRRGPAHRAGHGQRTACRASGLRRIAGATPHGSAIPGSHGKTGFPLPEAPCFCSGPALTTVDAIITLRSLGWQGVIHAVSRNGWLPNSHFRGIEYPDFPPAGVDLADLGLKKLVALMELHCARGCGTWAPIPPSSVDKMRPHTQRIWAALHAGRAARICPALRARAGMCSATASRLKFTPS